MKTSDDHCVPQTDEMLAIIEPLKALKSDYVFEGQKRHNPLSNMSMLMMFRRMNVEGVTVHGFRSTFRDRASEAASAQREVAEMSMAQKVGSDVERAYARSDLVDRRQKSMEQWSKFVAKSTRRCWRNRERTIEKTMFLFRIFGEAILNLGWCIRIWRAKLSYAELKITSGQVSVYQPCTV